MSDTRDAHPGATTEPGAKVEGATSTDTDPNSDSDSDSDRGPATTERNTTGIGSAVLSGYRLAVSNLALSTVLAGVVIIALGATVIAPLHGVLGGMFGVWGASLVLLGVGAIAFYRLTALVAGATPDADATGNDPQDHTGTKTHEGGD